jgi:beta-xylosidase
MGVDLDGNGIGEPVSIWKKPVSGFDPAIPATTDEFDSPVLGLQWQWNANHDPRWASLSARPGWLRLHGCPIADLEIGMSPRFLGQKFPARGFTLDTCVELSSPESGDGSAGLAIVGGGKSFAVGLSRSGSAMAIITRSPEGILEHAQVTGNRVYLRVSVDADALLQFFWSPDGNVFTSVGSRQSVTDGGWLGARVGLFHSPVAASTTLEQSAFADFSYFRFGARD